MCDKELNAQVQIRLNINYSLYAANPLSFKNKFMNELSTRVFHCPSDNIIIKDVREGELYNIL